MRTLIGFPIAVLMMLIASPANAQNCLISIDSIQGLVRNDTAEASVTLGFQIHYRNTTDSGFNITNGFVIYSPEGATWTDSASGNFRGPNLGPIGIDTTGLLSKSQFPTVFSLRTFSSTGTIARADGISPDTVTFSGVGTETGQGLPPGFDGHVFTIKIKTRLADTNKTICADSTSNFPSTNRWMWAVLYGGPVADTLRPVWSGSRCIRLVSKVWDPIQFNCPATITSSHCAIATYDFNAVIPNGTSSDVHYYLISGPGTIDSITGVWTAGPLTTGTHSIEIRAANIHNGDHSGCTVSIVATNVKAQFSASLYSANASVNQLCTFTPTVTDDCDKHIVTLLDDDGADGPVTIDSLTGKLSFTPSSIDSARTDLIEMRIMVDDRQGGVDTAVVNWRFVNACIGTRGNVDCDPNENVDITDLTVFISYLFSGYGPLCSPDEANCSGDALGRLDILDLVYLISHLFITFQPLPNCL